MPSKIVHLVLTGYWYGRIEEGKKRLEYRSNSPYWQRRGLLSASQLVFHRGYTKETMTFEVTEIRKSPELVELHLGRRSDS